MFVENLPTPFTKAKIRTRSLTVCFQAATTSNALYFPVTALRVNNNNNKL